LLTQLSPVQQQFLGILPDTGGHHTWAHDPAATPLYSLLNEQGFLDSANPLLRLNIGASRCSPGSYSSLANSW
jgi:hypothetical protein